MPGDPVRPPRVVAGADTEDAGFVLRLSTTHLGMEDGLPRHEA